MITALRRSYHVLTILLLLAFALNITACGGVRNVNKFAIVARPNTLAVNGGGRMNVKAKCLPGEQMLGGGYYAVYSKQFIANFVIHNDRPPEDWNSFLIVEASYPSAPNEWTVTIFNRDSDVNGPNQGIQVFAEAYCLTTPNFPVGMQTVQSQPTSVPVAQLTTIQAQCPAGSTVTGSGFKLDNDQLKLKSDVGLYNNGLWASAPLINSGHAIGWSIQEFFLTQTQTPPPTTTVYTLCATQNLIAADPQSTDIWTDFNSYTGQAAYSHPLTGNTQCASDEFTTGGGFEFGGNDLNKYRILGRFHWQNTAIENFSKWHIEALWGHDIGETASLLVWALCVKVPTVNIVTVKIKSPADGDSFRESTFGSGHTNPITFTASASDPSGNPLTGAALQWTVDGHSFGTGESFSATLAAGNCGLIDHKVMVTATDSASGHSASDAITVYGGQIC